MLFEDLFHSGESMHSMETCRLREPSIFLVTNANSTLGDVKTQKTPNNLRSPFDLFRCGCRKAEE